MFQSTFKMPTILPERLSVLACIQAGYVKERSADYTKRLHYTYPLLSSVSGLAGLIKEFCSFDFHRESSTEEEEVISSSWHHHPLYQYSQRQDQ